MSYLGYNISSIKGIQPITDSNYQRTPVRSSHFKQVRHPPARPPHKRHRVKRRRLRCDCGQLAITVIQVRVGSDPQYTIRLPLCPACLALEQSYRKDG